MATKPRFSAKKRTNPNLFIDYYRVSTDKQGERGLGMQAQQDAIAAYIAARPGAEIYASFIEVETATRKGNNRPGLHEALELAEEIGATLLIAKLDRLARNVHFISGLLESKADFIALDIPEMNKLTIHMLAAVAEHEAEIISKRTSAAIQAKIARGARWGNPQCLVPRYKDLSREDAAKARREDAMAFAKNVEPTISLYISKRYSLNKIARELNAQGYPTPSGIGEWAPMTVKRQLEWIREAEK
jgi:DNA invertase Pin-like site-specific DNA recombinase